ncbi:hypothetical protein EG329_014245 [Mollisiaceae sp. DMI_Dod_QoI]|nr:hypothetical protein EG329_014245 [Helotiales sp. DMI_Dod_QoI]
MATTTMLKSLLALLLCILPVFVQVVTGNAIGSEVEGMPGYNWAPMQFKGQIAGVDYQMNGSANEILHQFQKDYPEVKLNLDLNVTNARVRARDAKPMVALKPRNKWSLYCTPVPGQNWIPAATAYVQLAIDVLNYNGGTCGVAARSCTQISCSWTANIILCNDNYYDLNPSCTYLASYAADLIDRCSWFDVGPGAGEDFSTTGGQESDTDNYNIIVRYDAPASNSICLSLGNLQGW